MVLRLLEDGWPLDEIVFFDTGWEFPQMYEHIAQFERYTGLTVTRLHPRRSFEYWMIERKIVARKGPHKGEVHCIGNGWPSPSRRWCTREKVDTIERHCGDAVHYLGIASDEAHRTNGISLSKRSHVCRYPLYEWDMSEADALAYCKARGFDWGGLYELFPRVSCYCCPLQRIGQLKTLRREFPALWAQMLEWDEQIGAHNPGFRGYDKVRDLEARFALEDRQLPLFRLTPVVGDAAGSNHGDGEALPAARLNPGR